MISKTNVILFLGLLLLGNLTFAQSKIRYKAEGKQKYSRVNGERVRYLVEGVVFTQESTTVFTDSAVHYPGENKMEAFDNVRITDKTTTITSNRLMYEGDNRMARLRQNVIFRDGNKRMYTDSLDYLLDDEIAIYKYGGRLLDSVNTLSSRQGYFYKQDNYAIFYGNVKLIAPDYQLETDTLRYNTESKVAYTNGPTNIISEDSTTLYSDGGTFRTYIDQSEFIDGTVETTDYTLDGDELFFDEINKYYQAKGNVKLLAKDKDVIILGEHGYYDKENGFSKIYGNPVMKRILKSDTFYLAADTLIAIENEVDSLKRILAFPDIRIFKSNLQGLADSAAYFIHDSLIYMFFDPILWANGSQISADTINLEISNQTIKRMNLDRNSFLIAEDTLGNFNQVKGRNMIAQFEGKSIKTIDVNGNGETIFYLLDEGDSLLLGMNKLVCSNMSIGFEENDISTITVYKQPEGKIIPPHELTPADEKLKGFRWRILEKPELEHIFKKPKPIEEQILDGEIPQKRKPPVRGKAPGRGGDK